MHNNRYRLLASLVLCGIVLGGCISPPSANEILEEQRETQRRRPPKLDNPSISFKRECIRKWNDISRDDEKDDRHTTDGLPPLPVAIRSHDGKCAYAILEHVPKSGHGYGLGILYIGLEDGLDYRSELLPQPPDAHIVPSGRIELDKK